MSETPQEVTSPGQKDRVIAKDPEILEIATLEPIRLAMSDVSLHPSNPRSHNVRQINEIKASLLEHGYAAGTMVIQRSRMRLVKGHGVYKALLSLGCYEADFIVRDMDDEEALVFLMRDNRTSDLSSWDSSQFHTNVAELKTMKVAIKRIGFTMKEINAIEPLREVVEDDPPGVSESKPVTQMGDLWTLGKHRVLCGDSTKAEDVERVMDGEKADMVFTDPPYGVGYDGGTTRREKLAGDHNTDLYMPTCQMAFEYSLEKAALYLWYAGTIAAAAEKATDAAGYEIRSVLIWNKSQAQYGALSAQYKQKHELCYYCFKRGKAVNWYVPTNEISIWDIDRTSVNEYHPTQKPVALYARALGNSSISGHLILDLYLGSGTTLIAADQLDRICYGIEIAPKYCDVIVKRYMNHSKFGSAGLSVERNGKTLTWEQAARMSKLPKVT